jgi:hypothetical protein
LEAGFALSKKLGVRFLRGYRAAIVDSTDASFPPNNRLAFTVLVSIHVASMDVAATDSATRLQAIMIAPSREEIVFISIGLS